MMRNFVVVVLLLGALAFVVNGVSWAAKSHAAEAAEETEEAISHGKQGHGDVLVKHAEKALKHAEMSQKEKANMHMDEGIKHLKGAVDAGKKGDSAGGVKHAEEALMHIKEVK
jgi:Small metal-binding protein